MPACGFSARSSRVCEVSSRPISTITRSAEGASAAARRRPGSNPAPAASRSRMSGNSRRAIDFASISVLAGRRAPGCPGARSATAAKPIRLPRSRRRSWARMPIRGGVRRPAAPQAGVGSAGPAGRVRRPPARWRRPRRRCQARSRAARRAGARRGRLPEPARRVRTAGSRAPGPAGPPASWPRPPVARRPGRELPTRGPRDRRRRSDRSACRRHRTRRRGPTGGTWWRSAPSARRGRGKKGPAAPHRPPPRRSAPFARPAHRRGSARRRVARERPRPPGRPGGPRGRPGGRGRSRATRRLADPRRWAVRANGPDRRGGGLWGAAGPCIPRPRRADGAERHHVRPVGPRLRVRCLRYGLLSERRLRPRGPRIGSSRPGRGAKRGRGRDAGGPAGPGARDPAVRTRRAGSGSRPRRAPARRAARERAWQRRRGLLHRAGGRWTRPAGPGELAPAGGAAARRAPPRSGIRTQDRGRLRGTGMGFRAVALLAPGQPGALRPARTLMDAKSIALLEFPLIRERLAAAAGFGPGRRLAAALTPSADRVIVEIGLDETSQTRELLAEKPQAGIGGAQDIGPAVERAARGGRLDAAQFAAIAATLEAGSRLRDALAGDRRPLLNALARDLHGLPALRSTLERSFDPVGDLLDTASPRLGGLRRATRLAYERLRSRLEQLVHSTDVGAALQDPIITLRNGRYVVPVRADARSRVKGIVHDASGSGQTLFVEPLVAVE